jgi:hypothetical protein
MSWPNLRYLGIYLEELKKILVNLGQDNVRAYISTSDFPKMPFYTLNCELRCLVITCYSITSNPQCKSYIIMRKSFQ